MAGILVALMVCALLGAVAMTALYLLQPRPGDPEGVQDQEVLALRDHGGTLLSDRDGLFLHPAAARHLGLAGLRLGGFESALQGLHLRYLDAERQGRTIENSPRGGFRLHLAAFPAVRSQLADELRQVVDNAGLSPDAVRALNLEQLLFPFGYEEEVVDIYRTSDSWQFSRAHSTSTSFLVPDWVIRLWYEALGTEPPPREREEVLAEWESGLYVPRARMGLSVAWLGMFVLAGFGVLVLMLVIWAARR